MRDLCWTEEQTMNDYMSASCISRLFRSVRPLTQSMNPLTILIRLTMLHNLILPIHTTHHRNTHTHITPMQCYV